MKQETKLYALELTADELVTVGACLRFVKRRSTEAAADIDEARLIQRIDDLITQAVGDDPAGSVARLVHDIEKFRAITAELNEEG